MNQKLQAAPQRAYFLDWIRIAAFGLLVIYHVGMYYVSWDWHVKSPFASAGLEPWMMLSSPWRMALLFLVSGAATSFMLQRGAGGAFLGSRSKRLLLPLLCGVLVVVPPQSYFEVVNRLGYAGTYFDFLRLYFSGYGDFCRDGHCLILPTWNHLWFLAYLWLYTLALWALLRRRPLLLEGLARGAGAVLAGPRLLWLPILVLALYRLTLYPRFPSTHALVDDAYNHAVYFSLFLAGAVFAHAPRFWDELAARRWLALALALCGWLLLAGFARGYASASAAPEALRLAHRGVFACVQWSALVAAIGFARRHLDVDHAWRRTLTEAVFPVYILHQTIIIVLGQGLLPLHWAPSVEGPVLVFATFALSLVGYALVRAVPWLRPWFGLARGSAAAFPPLARAATMGLFTLMMVGLLLGCAASPDARRVVTPMGDFNVQQSGAGAPAVVFQSGLGDGAEAWRSVAPRIAAAPRRMISVAARPWSLRRLRYIGPFARQCRSRR